MTRSAELWAMAGRYRAQAERLEREQARKLHEAQTLRRRAAAMDRAHNVAEGARMSHQARELESDVRRLTSEILEMRNQAHALNAKAESLRRTEVLQ